ncbi:hypothetical protein LTR91_006292 [Friedmanniomyces endolithicus]|uniref:Uncharacterized protein n=1 Tax=Friedmanniomyces endolithicus TaxID=329885 RepID=A0AAN6FZX2_9PEZI|nr:hypothetical protein LTR35_003504 [Friedmanniomyces endolithicus]KAK0294058.1 hypothetical protein LTS00_007397 [Friedmanniomyces endolithicus]KAK0326264.1 hypothetical protein LTR82_003011 [Friedmanniomyces endolithicus]KAK0998642.1 hypothetical protein LTR91_006292 [Friedmanniomyces endolithicus]KAK1001128.1 hypothetical protein LTR54_008639 [Friedmanniomyces endolithicus]
MSTTGLQDRIIKTPLDLVGLIMLADIDAVARRTAYTGGTLLLGDALVLCPGLHKQQDAPFLSKGEYPACAALTTGYVFRVENEATTLYLQRMSKSGHLTTMKVTSESDVAPLGRPLIAVYPLASGMTVGTLAFLCAYGDWWAAGVLSTLILARVANIVTIRRRRSSGWHGQSEPGVQGDLLVLLSQDRWVRLRGAVDDLKAVTSGQWLRDPTPLETVLTSTATLVVYLAAIFLVCATGAGKAYVLMLMIVSAGFVMTANANMKELRMSGKLLRVEGPPKAYGRRLDLANELILETGSRDWALRLGMVQAEEEEEGPVTM